MTEENKEHIKSFLDMMPPNNYDSMYINFSAQAKQWGKGYSRDRIENFIKHVIDNQEQANLCDAKIRDLDEDEKNSKDIEDLIVDRKNAENRVAELENDLIKANGELEKYKMFLKKEMKKFDILTEQTKINRVAMRKMDIMNAVRDYFKECLDDESENIASFFRRIFSRCLI